MAIVSCPTSAPIANTLGGISRYVNFQAVITKGSADRTYNITFQAMWSEDAPLWSSGNAYVKILINNDKKVGDITRHHPSLAVDDRRTSGPFEYTFVGCKIPNGDGSYTGRFAGINHGISWVNIYSCTINAAINNKVIVNKIEIDTSETTGKNMDYPGHTGSQRPGVAIDGLNNWTKGSITNWDFKVEDDPELAWANKPSISNLRNKNPYKYDMNGSQQTMNNVSEYIDSIDIKCDLNNGGAAITKVEYSLNGGGWNTVANCTGDNFNIGNLTAGTSYNIKVRYTNSVGSTESGPITISTLHKSPILTITKNESKSNYAKAVFDWSSDKPLSYLEYTVGTETTKRKASLANPQKGTIEVALVEGGVSIKAKGRSTQTYHYRWSGEPTATAPTPEPPQATLDGELIFGLPIKVKGLPTGGISSEAYVLNEAKFYHITGTSGTGNETELTINPTQDKWDLFYKDYPGNTDSNPNQLMCRIGYSVTFEVEENDEEGNVTIREVMVTSHKVTPMILKGHAKTAHIGVNNSPRRAQVWYGDSSGRARRGVTWAGTSGGTHRCI